MSEDHSGSWFRALSDLRTEHGFRAAQVEGELPKGLHGTLYRNGPGLFSLFGRKYAHWFDGDGCISALRIRDGKAEVASRLVETQGLLEERRRGAAYFGGYGSKAPGMWNPVRAIRTALHGGKNSSNTAVLTSGKSVYALCEAGLPVELDPESLDTLGERDFGCVHRTFSAHPHRVASSGYAYNFGVRLGRPSVVDVYAMRPDGSAGKLAEFELPWPTMMHDFAVTERHLVFFVCPVEIDLLAILLGRASYADAMKWKPARGTELVIVPLDAPLSPRRFRMPAFWAWHVSNAFENGEEIVVDVTHYASFPSSAKWLAGMTRGTPGGDPDGVLRRLHIDPARGHARWESIGTRTGEFPRIAPRVEGARHRMSYMLEHNTPEAARSGTPNVLVSRDLANGAMREYVFAPYEWPSEPVFVPRGVDEDEGVLVTLVYDGKRHESAWWLFDAGRIDQGWNARVWHGQHVPLGFHGAWLAQS